MHIHTHTAGVCLNAGKCCECVCTLKDTPLNPIDYVLLGGSFTQHITHLAASGTSVALNYITECVVRESDTHSLFKAGLWRRYSASLFCMRGMDTEWGGIDAPPLSSRGSHRAKSMSVLKGQPAWWDYTHTHT